MFLACPIRACSRLIPCNPDFPLVWISVFAATSFSPSGLLVRSCRTCPSSHWTAFESPEQMKRQSSSGRFKSEMKTDLVLCCILITRVTEPNSSKVTLSRHYWSSSQQELGGGGGRNRKGIDESYSTSYLFSVLATQVIIWISTCHLVPKDTSLSVWFSDYGIGQLGWGTRETLVQIPWMSLGPSLLA